MYTYLRGFLISGLTIAALTAGVAHATGTDVELQESSLGNGNYSGGLKLPIQSTAANFWSGIQNITVTDGSSTNTFQAFCLDPFQWSSATYTTYTKTTLSSTFSATTIGKIEDLFSYNDTYGTATTGTSVAAKRAAAALQLALWEVVNDDGVLTTGGVRKTSATNTTLVSDTQALLDNYASYSGPSLYSFSFYKSATHQDFLVASPVPELETLSMMLAGLGILGVAARRRRVKSA